MGNTVTLSPLTNVAILVMAAAQLLLIGALVFLAFRLKAIVMDAVEHALDKALPRVQPVIDNVNHITQKVDSLVETVRPKIEDIASEGESAVHSVSEKVKTTSSIVTEGVAKPMANIAAILAGVQRGVDVWKTAKTHQDGATAERETAGAGKGA